MKRKLCHLQARDDGPVDFGEALFRSFFFILFIIYFLTIICNHHNQKKNMHTKTTPINIKNISATRYLQARYNSAVDFGGRVLGALEFLAAVPPHVRRACVAQLHKQTNNLYFSHKPYTNIHNKKHESYDF